MDGAAPATIPHSCAARQPRAQSRAFTRRRQQQQRQQRTLTSDTLRAPIPCSGAMRSTTGPNARDP
eukprot:5333646-Pyramimonas_sp.AAC.1